MPDSLPNDVAVFTEPVAAAYQIPAQLADRAASDRVVVLGDGRLGNLCAQVLAGLSDHVLVVGKHPIEAGAAAARRASPPRSLGDVDRRAAMADIVVDCTGSATGLPTALTAGAPARHHRAQDHRGRLAGAGVGAVRHRRGDARRLALRSVRPRAEGPRSGEVDVRPLLSDRFDLSDGLDALARAQVPGVLKVLLDVEQA